MKRIEESLGTKISIISLAIFSLYSCEEEQ